MRSIIVWTVCILMTVKESTCNSDRKGDEYLSTVQSECYASKKLFACFKYRIARYVWSFATGRINLFEYDHDNKGFSNGVKLVQLTEPENVEIFADSRQLLNDNEIGKAAKFLKRSLSTFVEGHGLRIGIGTDKGPRVFDDASLVNSNGEDRKIKKKHKRLNLIFPLAIILKILHVKVLLIPIILGIGLIQLTLIVGGALMFGYFRNNTFCKIQPHLIHSHSHVTSESGPEPASYTGYSGFGYGSPPYSSSSHYSKDWATNRAYNVHPFLDTMNNKTKI